MSFLKLKICMDNNLLHLLSSDFFQKTSNFLDFPEVEILPLLVEISRSKTKTHQGLIQNFFLDGGSPKKCDHQGITQKKSVSGSRTLPLIITDKKSLFSQNSVILQYFREKLSQKCPFLKIMDAALKF